MCRTLGTGHIPLITKMSSGTENGSEGNHRGRVGADSGLPGPSALWMLFICSLSRLGFIVCEKGRGPLRGQHTQGSQLAT